MSFQKVVKRALGSLSVEDSFRTVSFQKVVKQVKRIDQTAEGERTRLHQSDARHNKRKKS